LKQSEVKRSRELHGQYAERMKLYFEAIRDDWMARFAWPRAKPNPTVLAPEGKGVVTS